MPTARTLVTQDGVPIDTAHLPGDQGLAFVLGHGFTLSWQRPTVWRVATRLQRAGGVISFDFRGHGRSGGLSTLGDLEIKDLDVVVAYARELGYQRVATIGFSMGASIVVRYAGLVGGVEAAVSVSGPGRWYYRGTKPMRRVHWAVERRAGRLVTKTWLKTRVSPVRWDPVPMPPAEAAALISPIPFLVVHGDRDSYFPVDHAYQLFEAARDPKELWIVEGIGHAESGVTPGVVDRIGAWVRQAAGLEVAPALARDGVSGERPVADGAAAHGLAVQGAVAADGSAAHGAAASKAAGNSAATDPSTVGRDGLAAGGTAPGNGASAGILPGSDGSTGMAPGSDCSAW